MKSKQVVSCFLLDNWYEISPADKNVFLHTGLSTCILFVYLWIHLYVCLSAVCLPVCLSVCLRMNVSILCVTSPVGQNNFNLLQSWVKAVCSTGNSTSCPYFIFKTLWRVLNETAELLFTKGSVCEQGSVCPWWMSSWMAWTLWVGFKSYPLPLMWYSSHI